MVIIIDTILREHDAMQLQRFSFRDTQHDTKSCYVKYKPLAPSHKVSFVPLFGPPENQVICENHMDFQYLRTALVKPLGLVGHFF